MKASSEVLPLENPLSAVAPLILASDDETDFYPGGTAFFVAPQLALTARHVIDEFFQRHHGVLPWEARGRMRFGAQLGSYFKGKLIRWDIVSYWVDRTIDIAALGVEPAEPLPPGFRLQIPELEIVPPAVGAPIAVFGYPESNVRSLPGGERRVLVKPTLSRGVVRDRYFRQRDSAFLHFPSFHTDAMIRGGMSGGPVLDPAGRVCGVACSSMDPEPDGGSYSSFVSLIWPAMGLMVRSTLLPEEARHGDYPLLLAVEAGLVRAHRADLIEVGPAKGEGTHTVRFKGVSFH